ncbi:DUF2842 domain-containing protein [Sneathiella glossodoripedis]|uniref:DUF2842 domain-containing protein n=1 Tax=Sneathiella glossodoripedis TaxID=418853 RepID=UPI00046E858F|nr:DUF2842 domain-containing protein [Sneathiella glossodoripedis]
MTSKKVLGLILFLGFIVIYSFAAMLLAVHILPDNRWVDLLFYPVVGILWIFPAMKILRFMLPGDPSDQE